MGTVPQNPKERLEFYEAHIAQFAANAVAIGTTTAATTDLQTKITASRDKYNAKLVAEAASKTANSEWRNANEAMGLAGSAIIDQIRAKAKVSGLGIYDLAGIPAPATPTPVGEPGTPTDLKVALLPDGSIDMKFKCPNPAGCNNVLYHVFRSTTGEEGSYAFVGGSGERKFTDNTVPTGPTIIYYKIQAVRTTAFGVAGEFTVRFGKGSDGETFAAVAPKLAA